VRGADDEWEFGGGLEIPADQSAVGQLVSSLATLNAERVVSENVVDWALEDRALLSIRSRAHFARTLVPMTREQKAFWEYLNYGIVLVGLALIYGAHRYHLRRLRDRYHTMLAA